MKFKTKDVKNTKLTWQEVKSDGTISNRTYACDSKSASWHLMQMHKSPSLRNIKMTKI